MRLVAVWGFSLSLLALLPQLEQEIVHGTVNSLGTLAHVLQLPFEAFLPYVSVAGVSLEIITDCTPIMPTLVLWSAVFAFPAPIGWKLAGVGVGAAVLWVYNLVRILALALVLRFYPPWFEFVHIYLWQSLTLLVVLAIFATWVRLHRPVGPR